MSLPASFISCLQFMGERNRDEFSLYLKNTCEQIELTPPPLKKEVISVLTEYRFYKVDPLIKEIESKIGDGFKFLSNTYCALLESFREISVGNPSPHLEFLSTLRGHGFALTDDFSSQQWKDNWGRYIKLAEEAIKLSRKARLPEVQERMLGRERELYNHLQNHILPALKN